MKSAPVTPTKSSASSETTRPTRRSVSARSRKESTGGRLRRTSRSGSSSDGSSTRVFGVVLCPCLGVIVSSRLVLMAIGPYGYM